MKTLSQIKQWIINHFTIQDLSNPDIWNQKKSQKTIIRMKKGHHKVTITQPEIVAKKISHTVQTA